VSLRTFALGQAPPFGRYRNGRIMLFKPDLTEAEREQLLFFI